MEYKDVMEWINVMVEHDFYILPNDSVKSKISFISENGDTFSISVNNLKKSIKEYPPNRESIILAEKALSGGREGVIEDNS